MKKYLGLVKYLRPYKKNIVLYLLFIILDHGDIVSQKPEFTFSSKAMTDLLNYYLGQLIIKKGQVFALGSICVFILVTVFLKNLFVYLSYYVMSPIRNGMMVQLRIDLYNKILTLPIGFFTEQRKGDIMSRMTNDTWELESAVANTLDGLIKEPLNVLFFLGALFFLSPHLSLMLLVLLPLAGFIIGRISKSLKKQSNIAAEKSADGLSILEETLSGMRVIKAFNAEEQIRNKFVTTNNDLFHVKNKMNFRRDLASPISEVMGVLVLLVGIGWSFTLQLRAWNWLNRWAGQAAAASGP